MRALLERASRLAWIVCVWSAAGCAGTGLLNWPWHQIPRASDDNPAVRILCIWEPAEGTGLDGLPTRGFAGQIFFFTAGSPLPVKVDGDVRVYLFDDDGTSEEQAKPIHQFDFLGDAWTGHLHQGTLGPSYHVFIPYVRKHSYQVNCGLRVRLKPRSGPVIFSEMVHVTLPGPLRDGESQKADQLQSREKEHASSSVNSQGATLTRQTIPLASLTAANGPTAKNEGRGTRDEGNPHPPSQSPPPLRFKLEPAEFISEPSLHEHPLATSKAPKGVRQRGRQPFRRHPLADQADETDQKDEQQHQHPLAED